MGFRICIWSDAMGVGEEQARQHIQQSSWEQLIIIVVSRFYSEIKERLSDFVFSFLHHGRSVCGSGQLSCITFERQCVKYHMKYLLRLHMHCYFHYFSRFDCTMYWSFCVICFVSFFLHVFLFDVSTRPALFIVSLLIPRNLYIAVLTKPIKISI